MNRKQFLGILGLAPLFYAMKNLNQLYDYKDQLPNTEKMPVLFLGHGSPMNAIEENEFVAGFRTIAKTIPTPTAILCISAHWYTKGTKLTAMELPQTIHDFGGFPKELYDVQYNAPGSPELAQETKSIIKSVNAELDHDWGLDHGTWTVTRRMYPDANIPVLQISIDINKPAAFHYQLGKELASLRTKGVLVIGSGNMVHNLGKIAWDKIDEVGFGYDWAVEMHQLFKSKITDNNHQALINYTSLSKSALLAVPTPDHYFPLMYILGLQQKNEKAEFFNDKLVAGSINMTSVKFG